MTPTNDHDRSNDQPTFEPLRPPTADQSRDGDADGTSAAPATSTADPAPTSDAVAFSARTGGRSKLRVGVVGGAAVALAVGAVATSLAASPAHTPSITTGAPVTPGRDASGGLLAPIVLGDPDAPAIEDLDLGRFGGPRAAREITITAISGSSVTLTTEDGWTRTVTVDDDVELTRAGQSITLDELEVGDQVRFRQTRNDDGTYTVEAIAVVVPRIKGEVSDVGSSGFKVTTRDGSVWTITVDGSTEYRYGQGDGSLADVQNGDRVLVLGEDTGDNALRALTVQVAGDRAVGKVQSRTDSTIVIATRDGSTVTVHVDADTIYRIPGVEDADLGDVAVDMAIGVSGRERADGSIDADAVVAGKGGHRGLDRGRGFGGAWDEHRADDGTAAPSPTPTTGS